MSSKLRLPVQYSIIKIISIIIYTIIMQILLQVFIIQGYFLASQLTGLYS